MKHWQVKTLVAVAGVLLAGMAVAQTSVLREAEQRVQREAEQRVQREAEQRVQREAEQRELQRQAEAEFMRQAGRPFVVVAPGVVRDNRTKLEWMRCSLGQDWNEGSQRCDGTAAEYTFDRAQAIATSLNQAGGYNGRTDWRVPSKDELTSLVVCSKGRYGQFCANGSSRPTIAQGVFPGTPASDYRTSSLDERDPFRSGAWDVGFDFGRADISPRNKYNSHVRLVRTSQ